MDKTVGPTRGNPDRRYSLIGFVALMHHPQKRKYTGEPYHAHCRNVAEMAKDKCEFGFEIGMCHDLFEDTLCDSDTLFNALLRFGYSVAEANFICACVDDLSDKYTHEAFPHLNRQARKQLEAERLHTVCYESQTVKYCDLIDNTKSIVEHDPGFARVYIKEKDRILSGMRNGNPEMLKEAEQSLKNANKFLNKK
jgi:(p)ppGpp synthase/HD superfamily hydrolase